MKRIATDGAGKPRPFFSPEKISQALGVHRDTILRMIKRKELIAFSVRPGVLRVPADELDRLLRSRSVGKAIAGNSTEEAAAA